MNTYSLHDTVKNNGFLLYLQSFFGRCCNNMSLIGECRNNKECVIDKKNLTSCKACRLRKCLIVGMSKNGSRYGRRSNWFKQFFQETENHASRNGVNSEAADKRFGEKRANATSCSPAYFTCNNEQKAMSTDLCSSNSLPSHLYFNYFQHYNSNRLVSYGPHEPKIWLPNSVPLTFLDSDVRVNEYVEKLFTKRSKYKQHVPPNNVEEESVNRNSDNPLDLSQRRNES